MNENVTLLDLEFGVHLVFRFLYYRSRKLMNFSNAINVIRQRLAFIFIVKNLGNLVLVF